MNIFLRKQIAIILLFMQLTFPFVVFANEECKYCDLSKMYVGEDKHEAFNRKMFNLNSKLNKYIAKPVHIIWTSIMPQYGIDRLRGVYNNIEYPKRLASCLLQKDFKGVKSETKRFITNSTIGLGGMFDPAQRFFNIKPVNENMDQALNKCKVKSGSYMVMPVLSSCSPRSLLGRVIEAGLDPCVYLASPIISLVKFGLVINKTSYMQPFIKMVESTFADPYDIAKKFYGMENYIKNKNLDREDLLTTEAKLLSQTQDAVEDEIIANVHSDEEKEIIRKSLKDISEEQEILSDLSELADGSETPAAYKLKPDIELAGYNPQGPALDSMRTALFDNPVVNKSMWNELSVWNHCFAKKIKTDDVEIFANRDKYKYRYILQRDKNSPLAILYPSIGEGINSSHSVVFAKMLYDLGYSVLIQGSHFQWEFAKSMSEDYHPGFPAKDAEYLQLVTGKIINKLEDKNNYKFSDKLLVGTSFGAMETLFVAEKENKENTLGITKYIALSPPIELVYAMKQADKYSEELDKLSEETKLRTATTAAKIIQILDLKNSKNFEFKAFPFSEDEGKLIISFLIRQKLSDLVFTLRGEDKNKKTDFYKDMNNISFLDYAKTYLLGDSGSTLEDISFDTSLYSISDFLKTNDNYKIYGSMDDFFVNKKQIEQIKMYSPKNVICMNNGSHLGYLYRDEFLNELQKDFRRKGD